MTAERGPSGTGREYPPELVHGELCATRFGIQAACDCGKSEPPSGTGHDTAQRCPNSTPHRHHDWIYNGVLCRCPGALPPVAVPGPADPVVSPADTPAAEFPDSTPRPWYFDGWDIFTSSSSAGPRGDGHRMVIPLKAINDTFHPSQRVSDDDARLIVQAVNERAALLAVGERDRRQIARLTEALERIAHGYDGDEFQDSADACEEHIAIARAVLADGEYAP